MTEIMESKYINVENYSSKKKEEIDNEFVLQKRKEKKTKDKVKTKIW